MLGVQHKSKYVCTSGRLVAAELQSRSFLPASCSCLGWAGLPDLELTFLGFLARVRYRLRVRATGTLRYWTVGTPPKGALTRLQAGTCQSNLTVWWRYLSRPLFRRPERRRSWRGDWRLREEATRSCTPTSHLQSTKRRQSSDQSNQTKSNRILVRDRNLRRGKRKLRFAFTDLIDGYQ